MIFVINNYTEEDVKCVKECTQAKCMVAGLEVGPLTGTPHIQGAVIWKEALTFKQAQKYLGRRCATKAMKGTWGDQEYCEKDGNVIRKDPGPAQGRRIDIHTFRDAIRAGSSNDQLNDDHPNACAKFTKYIHFTRDAALEAGVVRLDRGCKKMLTWLWSRGPNMGKTTHVTDMGDVYDKPSNKWWDCYKGQSRVLIDDPTPKWAEHLWGYLKQWCNEKPFIAEIKGRSREIRPAEIYVCANMPPEEYFGACFDEAVFYARCKQSIEVTSPMWE